ncbi:baseplate multidomain protein megatron [Asticcacaulis machinosus]|uniref:Glycoside hydrolase/phage tail family protein n=1 Tax=Asticcacaulis machinosus TaxID=2984211 RepID=A0ABT5HLY5_9CAUL|nr:glycoside hydrolase/phage tail family protein [Asticcacaulis machinosus]MDC7677256.1 glycoside hydrolase/phage tail family protein [Asticcacaulis machinosus]
MAQVILSAVGTYLGGPVGGFIGSQIGAAIDKTIVNSLAPTRTVGPRLSGVRLNASAQGEPVKQVFGRARVAGTVIWAAGLKENRTTTRASKSSPKTESFTYSLSMAVGLCEGPIDGIGRIWADGQLLDQSKYSYRLYLGDDDQMPDAAIEAIEGHAPAYRGLAYMVFEDLPLTEFGNRPPNLSVEVFRRPKGEYDDLESLIDGVCLIPGAGEFIYATQPNAVREGLTGARYETQNTQDGRTDFLVSLAQLKAHLPNVKRVNLVISWFGNDLRVGECQIKPGVEQAVKVTTPLTWSVDGVSRQDAYLISTIDGRPVYGGTPSDQTVVAAIEALKAEGYEVTLIPFILMDVPADNDLPDPYGGAQQAAFPWRGRITSAEDGTAAVTTQVDQFFDGDWGFKRFVRHVATLGVQAGGVDAIVLGSEMRGVTTLHSAAGVYPAVGHLRMLAAEVRSLVGADTQISYGADWSEYFGHQTGGNAVFHLDPLWADDHIDFVGIDWYAPLTDWREGAHLDADVAADIYDPAYLKSRVRGGEGFDWYYASDADRTAQMRTPITDGAFGEPWVYRPKDILSWWSMPHHDRIGGVRSVTPTAWVPQSKPIRFIEYGCGAIDKGPNAPNLFLDPKSSESHVPPFSNGARDDRAQRAYLMALASYYGEAANNPLSPVYGGRMISGMEVWCWDARPYPYFPQKVDLWGDAGNWRTGHWLNGRVGAGEVRNLIADIAQQAGLTDLDLSEVEGTIDGYVIEQPMSAFEALSPVLSYLGLEVAERGGGVALLSSRHGVDRNMLRAELAYQDRNPVMARRDLIEVPGLLTLRAYDLDRDYQLQAVTMRHDEVAGADRISIDLPLSLTTGQAADHADYLLSALQRVRHTVTLDIDPLDLLRLEIGDGLMLEGDVCAYRVTAIEAGEQPSATLVPAPMVRAWPNAEPDGATGGAITQPIMTGLRLMDLPPFTAEDRATPVLIPSASPWQGADIYVGAGAGSLRLRGRVQVTGGVGYTLMALPPQRAHCLHDGAFLDVYLESDAPVSVAESELLAGRNRLCVRAQNGEWEIIQYRTAQMLSARHYRLSGLMRGQGGTLHALNAGVANGAEVITLPDEMARADMSADEIGLPRLWRAGPIGFGGAAAGAVDITATWQGLSLRPRAPVHGRVRWSGDDLRITWHRCARFGGDGWEGEPPLCEEIERYRLRFYQGDDLRREIEVGTESFTYPAAWREADFPSGFDSDSHLDIAQKSQIYGWGLRLKLTL